MRCLVSVALLVLIAIVPAAAASPGSGVCVGVRVDGEDVVYVSPASTPCPTTADVAPQCVTVLPGPHTPGVHQCTPALVLLAGR